jgi:hypothetical protein
MKIIMPRVFIPLFGLVNLEKTQIGGVRSVLYRVNAHLIVMIMVYFGGRETRKQRRIRREI